MKYLLLVTDSNSNNIKNIKLTDNFKIINVYKNQNPSLIMKIIRKVLYFSSFKMNNLFYDNWVQYLKDNEYRFIVFDDCKPFFRLAKFLKKAVNKPIIYYWNPIRKKSDIKRLKNKFEVVTYSTHDAKKYNLPYNHSFCALPSIKNNGDKYLYDTIFLGVDKGRSLLLSKIVSYFNNPYFYIVRDKHSLQLNNLNYKDKFIDYDEYINLVLKSKSIIDLVTNQNFGDTIRIAEAIMLDKKLITNKKTIKNEPYYNKNNIFIIDDSVTKSEILQFLNLPFVAYNESEKNFFTFESWLKRIAEI